MSHESPHDISPEHHREVIPEAHHHISHLQEHHTVVPDALTNNFDGIVIAETRRPVDDFFNEPIDPMVGAHGDAPHHDVLGHNKEEMLIDFNADEPMAHQYQNQAYTESQINTDPEPPNVHLYDSPIHATDRKASPEMDRKFNDSPQFPDEPSPAHVPRDLYEDDYQHSHPARYSPDQEDRKSIGIGIP